MPSSSSTKEEILRHMLTGIQEYNTRMAREELPHRGTDSFSFDLEMPPQAKPTRISPP